MFACHIKVKCQDFGPTQLKEHENLIFVGLSLKKKKKIIGLLPLGLVDVMIGLGLMGTHYRSLFRLKGGKYLFIIIVHMIRIKNRWPMDLNLSVLLEDWCSLANSHFL